MKRFSAIACRKQTFLAAGLTALLMSTCATAFGRGPSLGWNGPEPQVSSNRYLVEFKGARFPDDLSERIAALGGRVVETVPEIMVAMVSNLSDDAAAALAAQTDVADVTNDDLVDFSKQMPIRTAFSNQSAVTPGSASDPVTARWFPYQWNMRVIGADRAWQAGHLGSPDVRIAIIDTGADPVHPDLAPNIDWSRSRSFCNNDNPIVQQEFPGYPAWTDLVGHGTYVASIASSRSQYTAGVTTSASLMVLKGLGFRPCATSSILRSILYAANNGADVINMSVIVGRFPQPKQGQKGFFHYYHLYVQYALQKGVSAVVVAAGNEAVDLDHDGNGVMILCDVPGVICVSATGPTDSGPNYLGPFPDIDAPAFYTNFGRSAIGVAAPGGNYVLDSAGNVLSFGLVPGACASTDRQIDANGNVVPGVCTTGGYSLNNFLLGAGTSAAAPHVAGLAALLVGQLGHGKSAQVASAIKNSADDLGKPGVDPYYGRGRINVARALGLP